jgi:hypothetical protein
MFRQFGSRGGDMNSMMKKMMGGKMPDMSKLEGMDPKQVEEITKSFKYK